VKKHVSAVQFFERLHLPGQPPKNRLMESSTLGKFLRNLRDHHKSESAWSFNIDEVLPQVLDTLLNARTVNVKDKAGKSVKLTNDFTQLQRAYIANSLIVAFALLARASTIAKYGPLVEHLELPTHQGDHDADGVPHWIRGILQGDKTMDKNSHKEVAFRLMRNPANGLYCPVHSTVSQLMLLKQFGGGDAGPLFCNVSMDGKTLITDEHISESTLFNWWVKAFKLAGFPHFTTHSLRHSGALWAGRCRADIGAIMASGRWESIDGFMVYFKRGATLAASFTNDPIWKFWPWQSNSFTTVSLGGKKRRR
jgi:hypothetical protein